MSNFKLFLCVTVLAMLVLGAGGGCSRGEKYTARATVEIDRHEPHLVFGGLQKDDPGEFDTFRDTQQSLIKSRFVIAAALRDPKLKSRPCIADQDARHNALAWLTGEIHVDFPTKNGGVMEISASEPDREDAAAIVNAVVNAYWNEVVNVYQQARRERLSALTKIASEKEQDVRRMREQLKQELQNIGAGDEQTMALRTQLAVGIYTDYLRELEGISAQRRVLIAKQKETAIAMQELPKAEIPSSELDQFLGNNQFYRDLLGRLAFLESKSRLTSDAIAPGTEQAFGFDQTQAELAATRNQVKNFEADASNQLREAKRIELDREIRRLNVQAEILSELITGFEKHVDTKRYEVESIDRPSVAAQSMKAEIDGVEQVLRAVVEERERLKVELQGPPRVRLMGDPNSPAVVSESPD